MCSPYSSLLKGKITDEQEKIRDIERQQLEVIIHFFVL